ncbi:MAG: VOC family protein [Comamonadaceae bacterium]|nr:MAG: VOC family protein [Comamonadaceae bacterium]
MQLDCYLSFDGNCEEALNFYAQCLGGKVSTLMRYDSMPGDSGMPVPAGYGSKILHGTVEAEGAQIMASDVPPEMGGGGKFSGFSVSVWIKGDVARARQVFDALADGGQVTMAFAPPFWGGHFGALVDRFGVPWMVSTE